MKTKLSNKALLTSVGVFVAFAVVAATATCIYSPILGSNADTSRDLNVSLTVDSALNLNTTANDVNLAGQVNTFVSDYLNVNVTTNSQYGYTLTIEDVDSDTNLNNTNTSVLDTVSSAFIGAKTSSTMENNTWGYSLNQTDFFRVPERGEPAAIKRIETPLTAQDTTRVDFGVKIGNLTSGTYIDRVLFTAYVNGVDGYPEDGTSTQNPGAAPIAPMQDFSCTLLANIGDTATLKDSRDGNTYVIKKLADGKCWMIENLRIAGKTITSADSNVVSDFTIPESRLGSSSSIDSLNVYVDPTYGGYYNYYTATAGTGGTSLTSGNATSDICPKGWRLPTGGDDGEFVALRDSYESSSEMVSDTNFSFAGLIYGNSVSGAGSYGYNWSSTVYNGNSAYLLAVYSPSSVNASYSLNKDSNYSVRCLAK